MGYKNGRSGAARKRPYPEMKNIPYLCLIAVFCGLLQAGCTTTGATGSTFVEARLIEGDNVIYNGNRYSKWGFINKLRAEKVPRGAVVKMHIPASQDEKYQKAITKEFLKSGYQIVLRKPRKVTAVSDPDGKARSGGR